MLAAFAPRLPDTYLRNALAAADALTWRLKRMRVLVALAPQLPTSVIAAAVLAEGVDADDINKLAPYLPDRLLPAAFDAADGRARTRRPRRILAALVPSLPAEQPPGHPRARWCRPTPRS